MSDNNDRCILCNTVEGIDEILKKNGTGYWHVSQHRWKDFGFMVLTQNLWKAQEMKGTAPGAWSFATGRAPHGSAFAVGRLAGLEEWTDKDPDEKSWRGTFIFSEIARLDPPILTVWPGVRSSILYDKTLSGIGIDPSSLKWEPMPPRQIESVEVKAPAPPPVDALDDITQYAAKRLGFDPNLLDVSITIRRAAEAEAAAMLLM
jgi:hypothetical protein